MKNMTYLIGGIVTLFLIPKILKPVITWQEKRIAKLQKEIASLKVEFLVGKIKAENKKIYYRTKLTDWTEICQISDENQGFSIDFLVKKYKGVYFATINKCWTRNQRPIDGKDLKFIVTYSKEDDKALRTINGQIFGNVLGLTFDEFKDFYKNEANIVINTKFGGMQIVKSI